MGQHKLGRTFLYTVSRHRVEQGEEPKVVSGRDHPIMFK